jgi:hypothetical protein
MPNAHESWRRSGPEESEAGDSNLRRTIPVPAGEGAAWRGTAPLRNFRRQRDAYQPPSGVAAIAATMTLE